MLMGLLHAQVVMSYLSRRLKFWKGRLSRMFGIHGLFKPWLVSVIFLAWKHRHWFLISLIAGASLGYALHFLWPKSYRATALVLIEAQKVPDKYVQSTVSSVVTDRLASISQEILSNTRLQKIVDDFKLFRDEKKTHYPEEILEMMRKNISVRLDKGMSQERTGAFYLEFTGTQPTVVAEVTNRLVSLFLEQNLRERALSAEGTSEFLDGQLSEAKRNLETQEQRLADYKLKHEGSLPGQEAYISSVINRLQQELQFVEESIARGNLNKVTLENAMQSARSTDTLATQLVERTEVVATEGPRIKKPSELIEEQLEIAVTRYKPNHPDIVEMKNRLELAKAAERADARKVVAKVKDQSPQLLRWKMQAKERDDSYKNQIEVIDRELANRSRQRGELLAKIEQQQNQLSQLPVRELQMGAITRDYEISVLTYKTLLDKGQTAHISSEMERRQKGERFRVLDPAKTPEKPLGWNEWAWTAIGSVLLLLTTAAVIGFFSLRRDLLLGEWELPEGVPVLAKIPILPLDSQKTEEKGKLLPKRYKVRFTQS